MRQYAQIVETKDDLAVVEIRRHSSCDKCGKCQGNKDMELEVSNPIGAQEGDLVRIELRDKNLLGAALVVYLVPLLNLFLGYFVGSWFSKQYGIFNPEVTGVISGFIFLAVSFLIARKYGEVGKAQGKYQPEVKRVVNPAMENF
ncbi:MAG: SoxR reducing system RseC family protein [Bacillota bacterium]